MFEIAVCNCSIYLAALQTIRMDLLVSTIAPEHKTFNQIGRCQALPVGRYTNMAAALLPNMASGPKRNKNKKAYTSVTNYLLQRTSAPKTKFNILYVCDFFGLCVIVSFFFGDDMQRMFVITAGQYLFQRDSISRFVCKLSILMYFLTQLL